MDIDSCQLCVNQLCNKPSIPCFTGGSLLEEETRRWTTHAEKPISVQSS